MQTHYHAIYLAPHLDDATLSCGGQIYTRTQAGQRVLVATVTAGDPPQAVSDYAQSLHARWALAADAVAARRAEDRTANAILGADTLHWPVPDCIYRSDPATGQPFYVSDAELFGPIHRAEQPLVAELVGWLCALPPHDELYVPLTVGHHVDHRLTRTAAERAFGAALRYYEDYPYVQKPGALAEIIAPGAPGWQAQIFPLAPTARAAKLAAIRAFLSQLSTFWTDDADLVRQVGGYAASVGGERVWQRMA